VLIVLSAIAVMYLVERPGQRWMKRWMQNATPAMPPSIP
jgi:peptidoglycan/LPS O-acetylase OafA/YrhL